MDSGMQAEVGCAGEGLEQDNEGVGGGESCAGEGVEGAGGGVGGGVEGAGEVARQDLWLLSSIRLMAA